MKRALAIILTIVIGGAGALAEPTYPDGWVYDVESNWTNWRDHTYALPILTHEGNDIDNNSYFTSHPRDERTKLVRMNVDATTSRMRGSFNSSLWYKCTGN